VAVVELALVTTGAGGALTLIVTVAMAADCTPHGAVAR
jgi:hypothetical protein